MMATKVSDLRPKDAEFYGLTKTIVMSTPDDDDGGGAGASVASGVTLELGCLGCLCCMKHV